MRLRTFMKSWGALLLAPLLLTIFLIGVSFGETYWLRAEVKVIPAGTFGNLSSVTMWGYAKCTGGFTNCTTATVPGPTLTATGGTALTINVFNNISGSYQEPTSLVINGQRATEAGAMVPVWTDGTSGARGTDYTKRVRSFTHEAANRGDTATYTWAAPRAGTYLYESGTHPGLQRQMGLYGALVVGGAATDVTLLFSEIDPAFHAAVSSGDYGPGKKVTSPIDYHPKFFLVNGSPYTTASPSVSAGAPGAVRLRFLNAGLDTKAPTLQDPHNLLGSPHMRVVAEDGYTLPGSGKRQYSLLLPPGKTMDALITTTGSGNIVVYDRRLNLANGLYAPGGALINLNVGSVPAVTALPNVLNFGDVPLFRPTQMVVAVKNDGLANLIIDSVTLTGAAADIAQFRPVYGLSVIPPGTSVDLDILFRPTTTGVKNVNLVIATTDPSQPLVTIPISGNGL